MNAQHRTGCACGDCLGLTPAEVLARLGGEQGPLDVLRRRIAVQDAELTHRLQEMERWSDAALNAGEEAEVLRRRVAELEMQNANLTSEARALISAQAAADRCIDSMATPDMLKGAVRAAREACALVADEWGSDEAKTADQLFAAREIAAAIRARVGGA